MTITNAVLAITEHCNSRCAMCNIWRHGARAKDLPASEFSKLPGSLKEINVSGGEPFLRKDLPAVVQNIKKACPRAKLVFSTNGLLTKKIVSDMKEILKIFPNSAVRVSIDGMQKTHDKIRGRKGAFKKALATLRALEKIRVKDLGVAFTAQEKNLGEIFKVFSLAERNAWDYSFVLAQSSGFYFRKRNPKIKNLKLLRQELEKVIAGQLQSLNPRNLFRAWYESACLEFAESGKRVVPCSAASASCFVDAKGTVWACNVLPVRLGKLGGKIDAKKAKKRFESCNACFMLCSTLPLKKSVLLPIIGRYFAEKGTGFLKPFVFRIERL